MSRPTSNHIRRLAILGVVLALTALATALMVSPAGAGHKPNHGSPKGGGGGTSYTVQVTGAVATVDGNGSPATLTTQGKGSGTDLELQSNQTVKTYLELDPIGVSTHDSAGLCGSVVSQALDNAQWDFRFIRFEEGRLHAKFSLRYDDECHFDDYSLHFSFAVSGTGETVYTSDAARVFVGHSGETDDATKPKGKKTTTHRAVILDSLGHSITVTITPVI